MRTALGPLGGNTVSLYYEKDGLFWAWGRDAEILARVLKLFLRTALEGKTVTKYICFRYRGDPDELLQGLNKILPYNVALIR
jgi:hypothetical protein